LNSQGQKLEAEFFHKHKWQAEKENSLSSPYGDYDSFTTYAT
jgi:hypothetical protein